MRKNQSSITAAGIAIVRAIESEKPEDEVLAFGFPEGTIQSYLEQRGFTDIQDANHTYLHQAYFQGANQKRTVTDGYAIVSATVSSL